VWLPASAVLRRSSGRPEPGRSAGRLRAAVFPLCRSSFLRLALIGAAGGVALAGCSTAPVVAPGDVELLPAPSYIVRAFRKYPLVALSEMHGNAESQALFAALVRDSAFQALVSDIVVEFGNARYQDVVDRYVAGDDVLPDALSRIWRETTQISGIWDLEMYAQMLAVVRDVNLGLEPGRKIRVWLGDPPVDWAIVTSPGDEDMNDWRDAFFARTVQDRIRKHGRRALVFIGGAHIGRRVVFPNSLIHLLDARLPGETHVVSVLDIGAVTPAVAARLRAWAPGSAAAVRGSWLGQLDVAEIGFRLSRGTVEQDVDALALLSAAPLSFRPPPAIDERSPYGAELQRRRRLAVATGAFRGGEIRFAANQAAVLPAARAPLDAVLAELNRDAGLTLLVKAFADAREPAPEALSARRADAVVDWLQQRGVERGRLKPSGCGARRPLTFGEDEHQRERNRRAELVRLTATAGCEPPW
jgi:outer membrane protein OmpA-like peptidoglycan-associated protein